MGNREYIASQVFTQPGPEADIEGCGLFVVFELEPVVAIATTVIQRVRSLSLFAELCMR